MAAVAGALGGSAISGSQQGAQNTNTTVGNAASGNAVSGMTNTPTMKSAEVTPAATNNAQSPTINWEGLAAIEKRNRGM